ncbi:hypothetical protein HYV80_00965 [Candidatus Woesearchaeota archaeon]|nr:hypothetical protein [Candidatus Woesearchaeota archaeon]
MTKEIPIANWPNGGYGKVVQVHVDDKPYLRFRPDHSSNCFHGSILKDFLEELKLPYKTTRDIDRGFPDPNGERYSVAGMGWYHVDQTNKRHIEFEGSSAAYDLGIDKKHLDDIVRLCPEFDLKYGEENDSKNILVI